MQTSVEPRSQIQIFGVASCLGAQNQGCASSPQTLRDSGLITTLERLGLTAQWRKILSLKDSESENLTDLYQQLALQVQRATSSYSPFLVIGGDHSCAIGTWSGATMGLRKQDKQADLGLIWIDAHMDAHTPSTSPSGALHGMPVACLLGQGDKKYCDIGFAGNKIKPENLCLIGVRSYEAEEVNFLNQKGVKIYYIEDVRNQGLDNIMQMAVNHVSKNTAAYGISIDLDAMDPTDAPGVGSPEQNGLHSDELLLALSDRINRSATGSSRFIGAEITELNPERDVGHKTQTLVTNIIHSIFGES